MRPKLVHIFFHKNEESYCGHTVGFSIGLERREVEKRIYGLKYSGSRLPLPFMVIE